MSNTNNSTVSVDSPVPSENPEVVSQAEKQDVHINVESRNLPIGRIALGAGAVLGVLFLAFVIYKSLSILLLLFLALLIGTAIEPIVNLLRRGPFNRSAGILIVYSGLFIIIGIIGYILVNVFVSQLGDLGISLNKNIQDMKASVNEMDRGFLKQQATALLSAADSFVRPFVQPEATPQTDVESVATTALTLAEVFFGIITIFVVAFYWLSERTLIKRGLMSWLPARRANRVRRVWDDIEVKVGGWVRGQLTLMLLIGGASAVGYFLLGIKYWPALALFIGISEAIPLVGPYIGTAPAVLIALTQSGNDGLPLLLGMGDMGNVTRALLVVVFAVVLQTVEGNVLVPRIMKNSVGISPLTVIISILLGGTLAGLAGALIAVPLAGAIQVVISDLKAAKESDKKLAEVTAEAAETRLESGELVVAQAADGQTRTIVESKA
ncbi:MAG: AI-2E family transporter [Chloroflexota bacterium]